MSLPAAFQTAEEYFEGCDRFLSRYRFLFDFPNTDLLLNNVLPRVSDEGLQGVEVRGARLEDLATRNRFLKEFYEEACRVTPSREEARGEPPEGTGTGAAGEGAGGAPLGPKKRHEVARLARELRPVCERARCDTVVDFGSGLGYLDQWIYETMSYNVLGLECNGGHYLAAKKRQRRYHANSLDHVKYVCHTITSESHRDVAALVADKFGRGAHYCVAGLHACADLAIHAVHVFLKNADAKALVIVPCCYHKMREVNGEFVNFPLSAAWRGACPRGTYVRAPLLRLGAQPRRAARPAAFCLLARAALQLHAHARNCKIKRNKRKAVKTKAVEDNFESYIQEAVEGFALISNDPSCSDDKVQFDLHELRKIWHQITNSSTVKKAEIFVLLQLAIQEVVENLILFDILMYLRESGIDTSCAFKKIFDERISPRALALIAYK